MSTSPKIEDGGGGSDSTATTTVSSSNGTTFIEIALPDWVLALRPLVLLVRHPTAWIVAVLLGISITEARFRLEVQGQSPAELIVEEYLFRQLLLPLAVRVFNFGLGVVNSVINFFDLLASLPARGVTPIIGLFVGLGSLGYTALRAPAEAIAAGLAEFGLAAPIVVPVVFVVEVIAIIYVVWIAIQTLDLLTLGIIDDVIDIGQAALWPFLRLWRWLF